MDYFEAVGTAIERKIAGVDDLDAAFPDIATDVVNDVEPPDPIDTAYMVDWASARGDLPRQIHFESSFGQPPVVVFASKAFYIQVLFWFPSRTSIHGHGFSGAFRVLQGVSVQAEYEFEAARTFCPGLCSGSLSLRMLELIRPGDVSTIWSDDRFIHTVIHLGRPSLTLVVRTLDERRADQYSYYHSGLAYLPFYRKQTLYRQVDVLLALRRSRPEGFEDALARFLDAGDEHRRFVVLLDLFYRLPREDWQVLCARMLDPACEVHRLISDTLREVRRSDRMFGGLNAFPDSSRHLELGLADLVGSKARTYEVLEHLYPGRPGEATFASWNREVAKQYAVQPIG